MLNKKSNTSLIKNNMNHSFYFSGFGAVHGKYRIDNEKIEETINKGFINGFDASRVADSEDYKKHGMNVSPFSFFAKRKMGFETRYHVVPFPPIKSRFEVAESALDLGVKALEMAFADSGIDPEDISLWLAGCATPHEQAPGIAATIKCHFVGYNNQTPAATTTSACVGFNINIERAIDFFKTHPEAKHIAIVHTEVMSRLLTNESSFVPYVTFADAAAAVIFSRTESKESCGVTHVLNFEDMQMIDFLGADKNGDLYMGPSEVRERATENIIKTVNLLYGLASWNNNIVDIIIPHQTGNAIVLSVAKSLNIPSEKLYQDVQYNYGNLSGASIPFSLTLLNKAGRLKPGTKITTAVCGLGGEFGGFTYIVPDIKKVAKNIKPLSGKRALVTGATGGLGMQICKILAEKGCDIIAHYNSNHKKAKELQQELSQYGINVTLIQADFSSHQAVETVLSAITEPIDFLLSTSAITGNLLRASQVDSQEMNDVSLVNYVIPSELTQKLFSLVRETILFVGSVAEDAMFSGSSSYVSSKRQLHAYASSIAYEAKKKHIKTIYYMLGLLDKGMVEKLNPKQQIAAMESINQKELIHTNDVAERIVKSLYLPKVLGVHNSREAELIVRRDGYHI